MKFGYRGNILEIEDARITFRNFSGVGDKFNREGDKNFSLVIPDEETAEELRKDGWNVKEKEMEDGTVYYRLPVKVKFNNRGPAVYVLSGKNTPLKLTEETISMLDEIDIANIRMDLRPYDWEVNGKNGRTAYLQAMEVTQNIDRFGAQYAADDLPF